MEIGIRTPSMRLLRLLGLLPTLIGFAIGVMMQVGPDEAEINLCKWPKKLWPSLPDGCLHGAPTWLLYLISVALVLIGLIWLLWPWISHIFATLEFTSPVRRKTAHATRNKQVVAPPLSTGEQQFKTELHQFIKSNFDEIRDGMYAVNQSITGKYDEQKGQYPSPLSRLFLELFGAAIRPDIDAVDKVYEVQDDDFDTSAIQDLIKKAIRSYAQWQENVITFQHESGISPDNRSLWILRAADERAYGKLRDLKTSPYAIKLSDLEEQNVFASRNGVFSQWNDPTKK